MVAAAFGTRAWVKWAVRRIEADFNRSADTHLIPLRLPAFPGVHLYLKDESCHPSGSLKHRLARSLFLYAIVNGWLAPGQTVVEASSGSTAISVAYFAKMLQLNFIAVMPRSTSIEKQRLIEHYGGRCHLVESAGACSAESARLAADLKGHFLNQFLLAERATDWKGNNTLAASLFEQMAMEPYPEPAYVVVGAGTGGTSATLGRYARYTRRDTQVVVADPEGSTFLDYFRTGDAGLKDRGSIIEGIGRPVVEPSFCRDAVDGCVRVPDLMSIAALDYLQHALGRRVGGSTGTNFIASLALADEMRRRGEAGSIVAILCDGGERYAGTLYSPPWLEKAGFKQAELEAARARVNALATDPSATEGPGQAFLEVVRRPCNGN